MAQVRNLMRGISYTLTEAPAHVLAALDDAMTGLEVGAYATAILAHVEGEQHGERTCTGATPATRPRCSPRRTGARGCWRPAPERLLGVGGAAARSDHTVALRPRSAVVFYRDGLVERRATPLEARLEWLVALLDGAAG